ncbi:MAG: fused MFS/spermidine synthase [Myxococcota bacterium]|nr:fused MFS/spermidine synthase [Myxococcota bacterium]
MWRILFIAWLSGFTVMGLEMSFARMVAPYFGTSMPVWAINISTVLISMSFGYMVGGRLSKRSGYQRYLGVALLMSGLIIAVMSLIGPVLLGVAAQVGRQIGVVLKGLSLLGVFLLGATPLFLSSMLIPLCIRSGVSSTTASGSVAGRVHAAATIGSLMGTLVPALYTLAYFGTRWTLLSIGICCVCTGASLLIKRIIAVPLGLMLFAVGFLEIDDAHVRRLPGRILHEETTFYHHIEVRETGDGSREMRFDPGWAVQSIYHPDGPSKTGSWPMFLLSHHLRAACNKPPERALIIGFAAGTLARDLTFAFPDIRIHGVEIDEKLLDVAKRYFHLPEGVDVFPMDGRRFLQQTDETYDLILIDAYKHIYLPFHLATREFFTLAAQRLAPGGVVAANVLTWRKENRLARAIGATMGAVFEHVAQMRVPPLMNAMLYAWRGSNTDVSCYPPQHPGQRLRTKQLLARLQPLPQGNGNLVFTDDRAKVEPYTHRIIASILLGAYWERGGQ